MVEIEIPAKAAEMLLSYAEKTGQSVEALLADVITKYLERNETHNG